VDECGGEDKGSVVLGAREWIDILIFPAIPP
jgi:hypothetical protein